MQPSASPRPRPSAQAAAHLALALLGPLCARGAALQEHDVPRLRGLGHGQHPHPHLAALLRGGHAGGGKRVSGAGAGRRRQQQAEVCHSNERYAMLAHRTPRQLTGW